ncbi:MAG: potassium channel protein [Armatimonadota bacterium]|nr:potassium channel protein [Armatimonadota bacterium]MCX7777300.1 potassium channel protein [Armatimonadota bacterium]MDW8024383.1 potassium channel protein [Armatimonadota bacterium]
MQNSRRSIAHELMESAHEAIRWRLRNLAMLIIGVLLTGTAGYKLIGGEKAGWIDCLYMTVITVLTIGYGEVVHGANTDVGRIFTIVLAICGVAALGYALSTVTALLVEGELASALERRRMMKEIKGLSEHYIVCGAGRTGEHIIEELVKMLHKVVAVDINEERLRYISDAYNVPFVVGDATHEATLLSAGIERAKGLFTALDTDPENLYVVLIARSINPKLRIVARAIDPKAHQRLLQAGADIVVDPNRIGGLQMVSEMIHPTVVSFLEAMMRDPRCTYRFDEVTIADDSEMANKSLRNLHLPERLGVLVLAYRDSEGNLIYQPSPETTLKPGMTLIAYGDVHNLKRLRELAGSKHA